MKLKLILLSMLSLFFFLNFDIKTDGLNVGDKAIDFERKNVDESLVSLSDYEDAKGYIVIFLSNNCPFSRIYEDRIIALHENYAPQGYPVVAISSNDPDQSPADSFAGMQEKAIEKDFPFVYLFDETQEIAKFYGAARTPHVFLLDKELTVKYIGAIDDNYIPYAVDENYVQDALEALKNDETIDPSFTNATGCSIVWKDEGEEEKNNFPHVENPIPDRAISEGFEVESIDISDVFLDADGDNLTFSASSSDENVVTVSMSGNELTLTEVGIGITEIAVAADDNKGGIAIDTFIFEVFESITYTPTCGSDTSTSDTDIFTVVDDQPTPEGGTQAFYYWVQSNLTCPDPVDARVYVSFVLEKEGCLSNIKVPLITFYEGNGISAGKELRDEVVRVFQLMNDPENGIQWNPGKEDGKLVRVRMVLPITFQCADWKQQNNSPQVENSIEDQLSSVNQSFSFTFTENAFEDPDGDPLTYSAGLSDDSVLPPWLTFDPESRTFNGTPSEEDIGTLTIKLTATDDKGAAASTTFLIEITKIPTPNITLNVIDVTCADSSDGTISVAVENGDGTEIFSLDNSTFQDSNVFEGLPQGDYVVYVKNGNGTFETNTTVNAPPPISFSADIITSPACPDDAMGSITVKATGGAGNFTYSADGSNFQKEGAFSELTIGNYTIIAKDGNGCEESIEVDLEAENQAPSVPEISTVGSEISQESSLTVSNAEGSIQWFKDGEPINEATETTLMVTEAGSFTVQVTNTAGCASTSEPEVITSTEEIIATITKVYPVPAKEWVRVEIPYSKTGNLTASLFDMQGELLKKSVLFLDSDVVVAEFEVSTLPDGLYIVLLQGKDFEVIKKIQKGSR